MKILRISCLCGGFLSLVLSLSAQTFTTLHSFNGTDGRFLYDGLIQATDGNLYGTTEAGGTTNMGAAFKITTSGNVTPLYNFCTLSNCADGSAPYAGLIQAANGNFYGTTLTGGANNVGTVFKLTPNGALTTLYSFAGPDGYAPYAGLVQGTDGNFYGTTYFGGANDSGTVFKITSSGKLTTLHSFDSTDGANPYAGLIQATDGNFYGTTYYGGTSGSGTVFKITASGALTTLHSFNFTDGGALTAGLIQAANGSFYGTTHSGGADGSGTVFKITSSGAFTTLLNFDGTDGGLPYGGLVLGTDGNFYGTAEVGGPNSGGTVFRITSSGTLTTLYNFCSQSNCADGQYPLAALAQDTNGIFYGTTQLGGANNFGTVFSLSVSLGPFVETQPTLGKVGAAVKILGTNLTGATGVTFGGTAAVFTVVSSSEITTTVPASAETGKVQVTTPSSKLNSNATFRVTPQVLSFNPPSGPVGTPVTITGVSLTQTLGVGFGDTTPAQFTVNSDTQVTATVPTGAKTGRIGVETKGGTAYSATSFTVTQ